MGVVKNPYKFDDNKKEELLQALRDGSRRTAACESVGISRQTFYDALKDNPDFHEKVNQAERDANELVEDALFQAAQAGNVTACQVWLYNRSPDRWADKRQAEHKITGNIKHEFVAEWGGDSED